MTTADVLTREVAIDKLMDPRGRKWAAQHIKGSTLFRVGVVEGSKQSAIPEECHGAWTSEMRATKAIKQYLERAWNENDAAVKKAELAARDRKRKASEKAA